MRHTQRSRWWLLATLVAAATVCAGRWGHGDERAPSGDGAAKKPDVENPIVQLVRDPRVQQELGLTADELAALDAAYARFDAKLWRLRDAGADAGQFAVEKAALLAEMERALDGLLQPPQLERLRQLEVRARGWPAVLTPRVAAELKLTAAQTQRIQSIIAETQTELARVATSAAAPAERQKSIVELRSKEGRSVQELLAPPQRQALARVVGSSYDLTNVQPLSFAAPQLAAVEAWVNSEPLTLSKLRGKVVAFHFWAFNCHNCVNNLPHYSKWHDALAAKGLVVLGMHTPETQAERNVDALRAKVAEHKIRYPVAVDRDNQNWNAWANSVWPSVYLVDKRGRIRYWWYGEMNWQGTEGEKFMRGKIEQLLAESN